VDDGRLFIVNSTLRFNSAGPGGLGGDDTLNSGDTPGPGGKGGSGGGIWVRHFDGEAEAHLSGSLIQANNAGDGGNGGSYPGPNPGQNGTAGGEGGDGGGLFIIGGNGPFWRMRNNTLLSNSAGDGGDGGDGSTGGIGGAAGDAGNGGGVAAVREGGTFFVIINHNTVVSNSGGSPGGPGDPGGPNGNLSSGGGVWETAGGITPPTGVYLANSIVVLNNAGSEANVGNFLPEGQNLIAGNPLLRPLANNGGPTQTMAPNVGSPAIDRGGATADPLAIDQRGRARPFNGKPDIGSVEAKFQPDARCGRLALPATHFINNFYNPVGVRQTLNIPLSGLKTANFFVSAQNDGDVTDKLRVTRTRPNASIVLTAFKLTGGRANITSQLAAGRVFPDVPPQGIILLQFQVRARFRSTPANQALYIRVHSGQVPRIDTVLARIRQSAR